jgi:hypothetical protein
LPGFAELAEADLARPFAVAAIKTPLTRLIVA